MAGARQIAVQCVNATAQVEHICGLALDNLDEAQLQLVAQDLSRQVAALRAVNKLLSA